MPGAFSHLLVADRLITKQPEDIQRQAELFYWGAMGPDPLFCHPDDWGVIGLLYDIFDDFFDFISDVADLFEDVEEMGSRLADWVTGGFHSELEQTLGALKTALASLAARHYIRRNDVFEWMTPEMHGGGMQHPEKWWWIELGHNYRSGAFADALVRRARSAEERAFVRGYLSHVAGDVIGHALVNTLTGGPYRNHWRRHVLVEKAIDTYLWYRVRGEALGGSHGYQVLEIGATGDRLPSGLAALVADALNDVYGHLGKHTGVGQIEQAYGAFFGALKSASSAGLLNLPAPEPFDWFSLPEMIRDKIIDLQRRKPPLGLPAGPMSSRKMKDFLRALYEYAKWSLEVAATILTLPVAVLSNVLGAPARFFLLWMARKAIYDLHENVRLAMALGAYIHPDPHMLDPHFLGIVRPHPQDLREYSSPERYPWTRYHNNNQTYHLAHPSKQGHSEYEQRQWQSFRFTSPISSDVVYDVFFGPSDPGHEAALIGLGQTADIADLHRVLGSTSTPVSIESFSQSLIDHVGNGGRVPNWNLDGDRGYGWPVWSVTVPPNQGGVIGWATGDITLNP